MAIVEKTSVLIAGAGATGMTAALELMRFGIPARLIDQMEAPAITSRAVGVQARTLEEMELRGLADQFVRLGHPAQGGSIYGAGKRIFRLDFTRIESRYNFLLFLSQAETERILREALATKGVAIERGVRMVAFAQQPFRVTATLQHGTVLSKKYPRHSLSARKARTALYGQAWICPSKEELSMRATPLEICKLMETCRTRIFTSSHPNMDSWDSFPWAGATFV